MEVTGLWEIVSPRLRAQTKEGLKLQFIAEFCKASPVTVRQWELGHSEANGERLIRLWHLLAAAGSPSPEFQTLDKFNRVLSELYAYGVITAAEAHDISGQTSPHVKQVYLTLRGVRAQSPCYTAEELLHQYGDELAAKKSKVVEAIREMKQLVQPALIDRPEASVEPSKQPAAGLEINPSFALASLLEAASPLAKRLVSDTYSAQDRSAFRDLIGSERLFELSNLLGALCSDRARTEWVSK